MNKEPIENAIKLLKENLQTVARVSEWATLMGYKNPKLFSRHFLRHFKKRPSSVLIKLRIASITKRLQKTDMSCLKIAWMHSLPDEKALYNFLKRHTEYSPSEIKSLSGKELQELIEKSGS